MQPAKHGPKCRLPLKKSHKNAQKGRPLKVQPLAVCLSAFKNRRLLRLKIGDYIAFYLEMCYNFHIYVKWKFTFDEAFVTKC